jgi:hypothetical protein
MQPHAGATVDFVNGSASAASGGRFLLSDAVRLGTLAGDD